MSVVIQARPGRPGVVRTKDAFFFTDLRIDIKRRIIRSRFRDAKADRFRVTYPIDCGPRAAAICRMKELTRTGTVHRHANRKPQIAFATENRAELLEIALARSASLCKGRPLVRTPVEISGRLVIGIKDILVFRIADNVSGVRNARDLVPGRRIVVSIDVGRSFGRDPDGNGSIRGNRGRSLLEGRIRPRIGFHRPRSSRIRRILQGRYRNIVILCLVDPRIGNLHQLSRLRRKGESARRTDRISPIDRRNVPRRRILRNAVVAKAVIVRKDRNQRSAGNADDFFGNRFLDAVARNLPDLVVRHGTPGVVNPRSRMKPRTFLQRIGGDVFRAEDAVSRADEHALRVERIDSDASRPVNRAVVHPADAVFVHRHGRYVVRKRLHPVCAAVRRVVNLRSPLAVHIVCSARKLPILRPGVAFCRYHDFT